MLKSISCDLGSPAQVKRAAFLHPLVFLLKTSLPFVFVVDALHQRFVKIKDKSIGCFPI